MAQSLSDEQIQLRGKARRRLVGAIALVLVISALLPMVLDNKPKPVNQDIAIDIPKQDDGGFAPSSPPAGSAAPAVQPIPVIPSPVAAAPAEKPAVEAPPKPVVKPVEKAVEPPAAKLAEKPAEKSSAKTEPQDKKSAAKPAEPAKNDGFVVQLGAFSNADNAKQLQSKLAANRIKAYTDTLKTAAGDKLRVRAGPYASREEADKALAKIKQLGLDGKVVPK